MTIVCWTNELIQWCDRECV